MSRLWLTPTSLEQRRLADAGMRNVMVCGFGLAAAGAVTARLIAEHQPAGVGLIGIAGSLSLGAEVGQAYEFGRVQCDGIGAGQGDEFESADQMGWHHVEGKDSIGDRLVFSREKGWLLSVAAASGSRQQVERRRCLFDDRPNDVIAEDMEAFSVALACQLSSVPLRVIRGISNAAGDRDLSQWQIDAAIEAAVKLIQSTSLRES